MNFSGNYHFKEPIDKVWKYLNDPKILKKCIQGCEDFIEKEKNNNYKAKAKKLQQEDWQGNTFTISNLGMFDIEEFTAIINPPDACILAVGRIVQKPVVKNGEIVVGNTLKVTLSCDHRVVDGVVGSKFLGTLKSYLENPVLFMGANNI